MGVRVVSMAFVAALAAVAGNAAAEEPAAAAVTAAAGGALGATSPPTVGSTPWVATVERPSAAWVLAAPLTLRWPPPAWAHMGVGGPLRLDSEEYPDPRRVPFETFHLELRQQQDFSFLGVPVTSRIASYEPPVAPQGTPPTIQPLWAGDVAVRLPHNFYGGASLLQRVDGQRGLLFVAGQRF